MFSNLKFFTVCKRCSASLIVKEMQRKTQWATAPPHVKTAIIRNWREQMLARMWTRTLMHYFWDFLEMLHGENEIAFLHTYIKFLALKILLVMPVKIIKVSFKLLQRSLIYRWPEKNSYTKEFSSHKEFNMRRQILHLQWKWGHFTLQRKERGPLYTQTAQP